MTKNTILAILLVIVCLSSVFVNAQTDSNNWDKLNLNSTTIAGTKVYYEKSLEPNLPFFEKAYKQFLAEKNIIDSILSQKNQILSDINDFLGIEDVNTPIQNEILSKLYAGFYSIKIEPIFIVKKSTIKDFLKAGGQLPKLSYNEENDLVEYNLNFEFTEKDNSPKNLDFIFVIKTTDTFENNIKQPFDILHAMFANICSGATIHEVVELTFLSYLKPTDPYCRWFTDGAANVISYENLKKYFGAKDAADFIEYFDTIKYQDINNEINLRYWMTANYCLLSKDIPFETGETINNARYAYATFEVRRLTDKYGIDCIAKIINEISNKKSRTGEELLNAIKIVTGEDMDARFNIYQEFKTKQEAMKKYSIDVKTSFENKDYEQMADSIFRLHDFNFGVDMEQFFNDYRNTANCLFRMGFEKEADMIMKNFVDLFSKSTIPDSRKVVLETFCIYSFETNNPLKATVYADELLKQYPDNGPASAVKMIDLIEKKNLNQAKEIAHNIIEQSNSKESLDYQIASQVIAIDPNQIKPTP